MKMKSHDLIWTVAILLMFASHTLGFQVPTIPMLCLMLGLSANINNVDKLSLRLLVMGIVSQLFWEFSGLKQQYHEVNPIIALFIGVMSINQERVFKWSGLLWIVMAVYLEAIDICSMLPALIIYGTYMGGRTAGYITILLIGMIFKQYYYISAIPLIELIEFFNVKWKFNKVLKYAIYPAHLVGLHFII